MKFIMFFSMFIVIFSTYAMDFGIFEPKDESLSTVSVRLINPGKSDDLLAALRLLEEQETAGILRKQSQDDIKLIRAVDSVHKVTSKSLSGCDSNKVISTQEPVITVPSVKKVRKKKILKVGDDLLKELALYTCDDVFKEDEILCKKVKRLSKKYRRELAAKTKVINGKISLEGWSRSDMFRAGRFYTLLSCYSSLKREVAKFVKIVGPAAPFNNDFFRGMMHARSQYASINSSNSLLGPKLFDACVAQRMSDLGNAYALLSENIDKNNFKELLEDQIAHGFYADYAQEITGKTLFEKAFEQKHYFAMWALLEKTPRICNEHVSRYCASLFYGAFNKEPVDFDVMERVVNHTPKDYLIMPDKDNWTPLCYTLFYAPSSKLPRKIAKRVPREHLSARGGFKGPRLWMNALIAAVWADDRKAVNVIVNRMNPAELVGEIYTGGTILYETLSIDNYKSSILRSLIKRMDQAGLNCVDAHGNTVLASMLIAYHNDLPKRYQKCISLLIEKMSPEGLKQRNIKGESAYDIAIRVKYEEVAAKILSKIM